MRRLVRFAWRLCLYGLAALIAVAVLTTRWGDAALYPARGGEEASTVFAVNHGYHAGIIIPQESLAAAAETRNLPLAAAMAAKFGGYLWLEIGWGDEDFYRHVPDAASLTWRLAARAMLGLNQTSVLHVVGFDPEPEKMFRGDMVQLRLSKAGFERLAAALDATFRRSPYDGLTELGPGNYGPSLFYRAEGRYSAFNLCNHWVGRLLAEAGVPAAPVLASHPRTLLWDLRLRAGAK